MGYWKNEKESGRKKSTGGSVKSLINKIQNQDSLVSLTIPIIPSSVCFTGNTTDILNQFSQQYLNNATIDIPGLGLVTPAQIIQLQEDVVNLQNEIDALPIATRNGNQVIATGDNTYSIAFGEAMPSALYDVSINFIATTGVGTTAFSWSLVGTPTSSGFSVRTYDIVADIGSFNWVVRQYAA